jgi:hypothetical protein
VLASLLALLPILASHHLPLVDAPAHEARLAVLWRLLNDGGASPFYAATSFFLPNIAFDAGGLLFAGLAGPETIGRAFFAVTLLLTLWGILILNRVVTGRWSSIPLVAAILLYNFISILGFLSYAFGMALVSWALAGRLTLGHSRPVAGFVLGSALGILLLFCHAFAFGIYAATFAAFLASAVIGRRIGLGTALVAGLEFVPSIALFLMMSIGTEGHLTYLPPFVPVKAAGLFEAMTSGCLIGDIALAVGLIAFIRLVTVSAKVALAPGFALVLAALFGLYLALPFELGSGANVDKRMPIVIAFLALAGLDIRIRLEWTSYRLAAIVVAALVVKQSALVLLWHSFDPTIDAAVSALKTLPPGSVIMQTECHPPVQTASDVFSKWQPPMTHLAALATFDDDRFAASSWAIPGQQPMTVKPRYEPYNRLQATFPSSSCRADEYRTQISQIHALDAPDSAAAPPIYFLVIRPPGPNMLAGTAVLIATGRDFELYAVRKPD